MSPSHLWRRGRLQSFGLRSCRISDGPSARVHSVQRFRRSSRYFRSDHWSPYFPAPLGAPRHSTPLAPPSVGAQLQRARLSQGLLRRSLRSVRPNRGVIQSGRRPLCFFGGALRCRPCRPWHDQLRGRADPPATAPGALDVIHDSAFGLGMGRVLARVPMMQTRCSWVAPRRCRSGARLDARFVVELPVAT